jgi:hypothetical protein
MDSPAIERDTSTPCVAWRTEGPDLPSAFSLDDAHGPATLTSPPSTDARPRACAVGVYRLWRDAGFAIGALVAGLIADLASLVAAVWVIAALTAASGLVAVRLYETHPSAARL